jgi:hypothetical protein
MFKTGGKNPIGQKIGIKIKGELMRALDLSVISEGNSEEDAMDKDQ